jgi:hypothetical protein
MRLVGRRIREVHHVYGEDEVPDHDEWSQSEQPTRELGEREAEQGAQTSAGVAPARPHTRTRTLHRVLVMTLLGAVVGVVAALGLHSVSGFTGGKRGGAGRAGPGGVALLPTSAPSAAVASVPAGAPAQPTIAASRPHDGRAVRRIHRRGAGGPTQPDG